MISNGFILRQYREIYGFKQWELSARLGFSSTVLCDIERGRKPLTPEIRKKAERVFRNERARRGGTPARIQLVEVAV